MNSNSQKRSHQVSLDDLKDFEGSVLLASASSGLGKRLVLRVFPRGLPIDCRARYELILSGKTLTCYVLEDLEIAIAGYNNLNEFTGGSNIPASQHEGLQAEKESSVLFTATLSDGDEVAEVRDFYSIEDFRDAEYKAYKAGDGTFGWSIDCLKYRSDSIAMFDVVRDGKILGWVAYSAARSSWLASVGEERYGDAVSALLSVLRSHGIGTQRHVKGE